MTSQQFCKINCNSKVYYLKTTFSERHGQGIKMILSDTVNAWMGEMTEKCLEEWSKKSKMKRIDYESATRVALTGDHDTGTQFEYIVTHGKSGDSELSWKKIISEDGIKIQLGSVTLSKCSAGDAVGEIFEFVIESIDSFKHQMSELVFERDRLARERETAAKKLEKCAKIKEDTEIDLYSKFVLVLNAKKEKLRQLRQKGTDSTDNFDEIMSSTSANIEPRPGASHSDNNGASKLCDAEQNPGFKTYNSDVDTDEEENTWKHMKELKSGRRVDDSSADRGSTSNDVSLVLGEDSDVEPDDTVLVKRLRKSARSTKQTTKPVIPQVSKPTQQESSTSKSRAAVTKGSLKKLSSKLSNTSSNIDTNDLLDNLA